MLPSKEELIFYLSTDDPLLCSNSLKKQVFGATRKTLLHLAARYASNPATIALIVKSLKISPSKTTNNKVLPIHTACKHGNLITVQTLLSLWPKSLEKKDMHSNTPLLYSCIFNQPSICAFLLSQGAKICIKKTQTPALHVSITRGFLDIVRMIVESLDCQVWACIKLNCLQLAVETGCNQIIVFLLEKMNYKETCTFPDLLSVLKACKTEEILTFLLEYIKGKYMNKLVMLLELEVSSKIIMKYCESELRANALKIAVLYDRSDLLKEMYYSRMVNEREILGLHAENLREKCAEYLVTFKRMQQCRGVLYVKKFCKEKCINRLPDCLVRQVLTYI